MRKSLMAWAMVATTRILAGQTVTVAVCNLNQSPDTVIRHAESEAGYVFRSAGVEIRWVECGDNVGAQDSRLRPDFVVRVQNGGHFVKAGPVSLDAMGRAFMDETGYGFMADTYFGAIRDLSLLFPYATADQLLGYVMAHELGHLLIGAGHRPNGIMRSSLGKMELDELNRRHLKFNAWESAAIQRTLEKRRTAGKAR